MMNHYCMCKGKLLFGAPFKAEYEGSPHYIVRIDNGSGQNFDIVVNAASTEQGEDGDNKVYCFIDQNFIDPIGDKLNSLAPGLYTDGFPALDYWQDSSLLDLRRMRPVPYNSEDGTRFDINDDIDDLLTIDEDRPSQKLTFFNGRDRQLRVFWPPAGGGDVTVYGFGFRFDDGSGLHETHMNQGNPRNGRHWRENGTFQDGALIVQRGDTFGALFTAFQTQWLPTDARGFPTEDAVPLPRFIRNG